MLIVLLKQRTCLGVSKQRLEDQLSAVWGRCEFEFSLWKWLAELRLCD